MWTITASAAVDSVLLFAESSESLARLLLAPLVAAAAAVGVRALYAAPGITSISEALVQVDGQPGPLGSEVMYLGARVLLTSGVPSRLTLIVTLLAAVSLMETWENPCCSVGNAQPD